MKFKQGDVVTWEDWDYARRHRMPDTLIVHSVYGSDPEDYEVYFEPHTGLREWCMAGRLKLASGPW